MKNLSKSFSLFLVASCIFATPAQALTNTQITALGGLISATYLLYARDIDKSAKPRYSIEKLKKIKHISGREYLRNLWYFVYDGIIGQRGKGSTKPFGILATIDYHLALLKKAGGVVAFGYGMHRIGLDLEKHITHLAKHKEKDLEDKKA